MIDIDDDTKFAYTDGRFGTVRAGKCDCVGHRGPCPFLRVLPTDTSPSYYAAIMSRQTTLSWKPMHKLHNLLQVNFQIRLCGKSLMCSGIAHVTFFIFRLKKRGLFYSFIWNSRLSLKMEREVESQYTSVELFYHC